jgi:hypothetical protein
MDSGLSTMDIPLAGGLFAVIDDADYPLISGHHWYPQRHRHTWYALANVPRNDGTKDKQGRNRRTTIKMHRTILGAAPGTQTDHRDGNGLNNRRLNISIASHAANQQNQHTVRARSGAMGVRRTRSGKYQVQRKRNGKTLCLGTFPTIEQAIAARATA